jgi:hypothetical protein
MKNNLTIEKRKRKNDANKKYRLAHPEQTKKDRMLWHEKFRAEWRRKNRLKYRAHTAISNKVHRGFKKPEVCQECGIKCLTEAHHKDYSKPHSVDWLCHLCHLKKHEERI